MKLAIVCCLHGNERYGMEVIKRLPTSLPFFIGNPRALEENKRFIDVDLNRCFPGKENGNYEERRAFKLVNKLKDFDYVIDLHSSTNNCPLFGIITKPNEGKTKFAKKLRLKRLVIMPEYFASGKALIDFVKCGISLEIGPHTRRENIDEVSNLISKFVDGKILDSEIEIFEVIDIIKKEISGNILIKNFEEVKKEEPIIRGEFANQIAKFDFVPVLVGEEAYRDILCLAMQRGIK